MLNVSQWRRMPFVFRVLVLAALLLGVSATAARAYDCRGSFFGCGHKGKTLRKQLVRQCQGVCRTYYDRCTTAFNKGRMRTRCWKDMVATCLTAGGTCAYSCDDAHPCSTGKQCVDGQCILDPPDRCGGCVSGYVSLPCQAVGSIPFHCIAQFQNALNTVINQWLAATAGLPDCTRGATTYSPYDGSSFTVTFSVTCSSPAGSVSETINITVQHS